MNKIDKHFVSEIDQFLTAFDQTHAKTPSQVKEIEKHARIAKLRDEALPPEQPES
jgi:hypothetical protein